MSELELLKVRCGELAKRCLAVRDALNVYRRDNTAKAAEELDRLVGQCNTPDLIDDLQAAVALLKEQPQIVTLYAVHQGDDDRSSGTPRWFFRSSAKANEVAWKRGWYQGNAPVSECRAAIVDGKAYLLDLRRKDPVAIDVSPDDELAAKQRAMSKLTPDERKLLGIH